MENGTARHESSAADYSEALDGVAGDLEAVEAAMSRLDDGTYGRCRTCGREISEEELARDPLATACPEHLPAAPS